MARFTHNPRRTTHSQRDLMECSVPVSGMSKRQRRNHILIELNIPGYLKKHLLAMDTEEKVKFNDLFNRMHEGKVDVDVDSLRAIMDTVDRARYASQERDDNALTEWRNRHETTIP